jgi:aspartate carbamoyltransferase
MTSTPLPTTILEPSLSTLTEDPESWKGSSLQSVAQITPSGLKMLFQVAQEMRTLVREKGGDDRLKHTVLSTVFFEASTRTSCSFQTAMLRLGGSTIHVDGQGNSSAGKKGETLDDTIKCLQCYADVTVLRHPEQGSVGRVIKNATKPIINAGDGTGEHPSQALLDIFTISDELDLPEYNPALSLTVVLLGDLKHGRTVHSLAKLLAHSKIGGKQLTLRYCAPNGLEMPEEVREFCAQYDNVTQETHVDPKEACKGAHVLYVTRIQRERFESDESYAKVKGYYVIDENFMKEAPPKMIVLHPLPRVNEISTTVDSDPRAAYFRQMENGMFVRMALLSLVLGKGKV